MEKLNAKHIKFTNRGPNETEHTPVLQNLPIMQMSPEPSRASIPTLSQNSSQAFYRGVFKNMSHALERIQ